MPDQLEILGSGVYLQLIRDGRWEYADRIRGKRAAAIIAVTAEKELVLTEQYRVPVKSRVIDLPAGLVGDDIGNEDEDCAVAAQRELLEETGFHCDQLEFLFFGSTSAGLASETVHYFYAPSPTQVHQGGGVHHEEIQVHVVPLKTIDRWLRQQQETRVMVDIKVYGALGLIRERRLLNKLSRRKSG